MKTLILASLLTGLSGTLLYAAETNRPHLNSFQREALATQSPRVHVRMHKGRAPDRIEKSKTTINAYIPYGK
ncbi:MAG TPA: hypothetical protein VEV17_06985 [Bryobacteraceae bacterium]|nr:hypothetical protein [Bryobacteraceae bacterium]